jgi:hypothetical protein
MTDQPPSRRGLKLRRAPLGVEMDELERVRERQETMRIVLEGEK